MVLPELKTVQRSCKGSLAQNWPWSISQPMVLVRFLTGGNNLFPCIGQFVYREGVHRVSLHPQAIYPIPEETQRVARAAFPRGHIYMQVADRLGTIYHDAQFAALFPTRGQPAEAPARLALVTVLQFAEGLSDRQAADAVRSRIDWKYVLGLELTDPGFHHTVLSEFRTRLVAGEAASHLLDALLTLARAQALLQTRGRQRTDATQVLASMRILNRLERVGETLRATLNSLAVVAPAW
jgi:transposase